MGWRVLVGYSITDRKSSSVKFIHYYKTEDALLHCKRACFTLQKGIFYHAKGRLLQRKRASFTMRFVIIRYSVSYKPTNRTFSFKKQKNRERNM